MESKEPEPPLSNPADEWHCISSDWEIIPIIKFPHDGSMPGLSAAEISRLVMQRRQQRRAEQARARREKGLKPRPAWVRYHFGKLPAWVTPGEAGAQLLAYWRRPIAITHLLFFLMLVLIFIAQASVYGPAVIDDAYITFRFVDMFVKGHGWRFNPEGPRVEGFTNFLWAVILVPPHWLQWDLMTASKWLGMFSAIGAMAASWGLARAVRQRDDPFNLIPPALLATNAHFAHWAMMGLETQLAVALVIATYWRFEVERRDAAVWMISPLIAVLAAMTRIDSLYYLSPLGLYGWWLTALGRMRLKRLLLWAAMAAVPFMIYQSWRLSYFGDWAPNTYYAKQRLVRDDSRARGVEQLRIFYFDQGNHPKRVPPTYSEINWDQPGAYHHAVDRFFYTIGFTRHNSLLWMNFWVISLALTIISAATWLMKSRDWLRRKLPRRHFLRQPHLATAVCLVLLPWGMNVFYVYYVDGDWMPNFRFFQIALPFIGLAGAIGFGWVADAVRALDRRALVRWPVIASSLGLAGWLLAGNASEQLRTESIFIFGPNSEHWAQRKAGWAEPSAIRANYGKPYAGPLDDVSNFLLLETQDDSAIFMSDIGQPLWYADHLALYDVDGLTDPYLAHAPSRRGDLPTVEEHFAAILNEKNIMEEELSAGQRARFEVMAERRDFEAHLNRNREYILAQEKPEYLLIFVNHERPDPTSRGFAYPEISAKVWNDPRMEEYEEIGAFPKIGNVYNHVYKRKEIPREVPARTKLERLFHTIDRNPRITRLVTLLQEQAETMQDDLMEKDWERMETIYARVFRDYPTDQHVARLARKLERTGQGQFLRGVLERAIENEPRNMDHRIALANLLAKEDVNAAINVMLDAKDYQYPGENEIHYRLAMLLEQTGRRQEALEIAREATIRVPSDTRAWSDRASIADRASWDNELPDKEKYFLKLEALWAFDELAKLQEHNRYIRNTYERLEKESSELEDQLGISRNAVFFEGEAAP